MRLMIWLIVYFASYPIKQIHHSCPFFTQEYLDQLATSLPWEEKHGCQRQSVGLLWHNFSNHQSKINQLHMVSPAILCWKPRSHWEECVTDCTWSLKKNNELKMTLHSIYELKWHVCVTLTGSNMEQTSFFIIWPWTSWRGWGAKWASFLLHFLLEILMVLEVGTRLLSSAQCLRGRKKKLWKLQFRACYKTMFVNETIKAGAARSTVKPQHNRVLGRISFRSNEVIEQILFPRISIYWYIPAYSKSHILVMK